jgi:hypothetical protein
VLHSGADVSVKYPVISIAGYAFNNVWRSKHWSSLQLFIRLLIKKHHFKCLIFVFRFLGGLHFMDDYCQSNNSRKKSMQDALSSLDDSTIEKLFDTEAYFQKVVKAVESYYGSSAEHILSVLEYGEGIERNSPELMKFGFKLQKHPTGFVASILALLTLNISIPDDLKEYHPDLQEAELKSVLWFASCVIGAFERYYSKDEVIREE